ncbi:MAG: alpha/beta fold hydrolase [Candidatus Lokiarchaeota archaeon]|nr:alpha/beta fold hydrolase [Candidatus Lokiarchaeota archaeon]
MGASSLEILIICSTLAFLIVFAPFEIFFTFRDIWYDRWTKIETKEVEISKVKILVDESKKKGHIIANVITPQDKNKVDLKKAVIIVNHGLGDKKETLQYMYLPLAVQGYIIVAYDARGHGKSKKVGKRSHFVKRIEDYKKIIDWINNHDDLKDKKIHTIGFSIGGLVVLAGSFKEDRIEKIIAISAISDYKKTVRRLNPIVLLSFLLKGIKIFPKEEEIKKLSPVLIFKELKKNLSKEEWIDFTKKIFLIHSKNDQVIKFYNFEDNISILNLPEKNQLVFKKGGHTSKKNEVALIGAILNFLNN